MRWGETREDGTGCLSWHNVLETFFFDAASVKKGCEVSDAYGQSGGALLTAPHVDAGG